MSINAALKKLKASLPDSITVSIRKTEDGLYAKIKELPHCNTQADNFVELIGMVNDAVLTYLNVPEKYKASLGFYAPVKFIDEVKRQRWQKAVTGMLKNDVGDHGQSIFSRVEAPAR